MPYVERDGGAGIGAGKADDVWSDASTVFSAFATTLFDVSATRAVPGGGKALVADGALCTADATLVPPMRT
jgi:hypothetical protein